MRKFLRRIKRKKDPKMPSPAVSSPEPPTQPMSNPRNLSECAKTLQVQLSSTGDSITKPHISKRDTAPPATDNRSPDQLSCQGVDHPEGVYVVSPQSFNESTKDAIEKSSTEISNSSCINNGSREKAQVGPPRESNPGRSSMLTFCS